MAGARLVTVLDRGAGAPAAWVVPLARAVGDPPLATLERVGLAYAPAHYRPSATHAFKDLRFDLAVAVAPSCVAVGVAALLWARAQHVARAARLASPLLAKVDAALAGPVTPAAWDRRLADMAMVLSLNNGARALADAWRDDTMHGNTTDRWLLKAAEDHDAIASAANRDVARATTMRYLLAEVSP